MFTYTVRRLVDNDLSLVPVVDKWWEITLAFTIAVNVLTPSLIIGRLWYAGLLPIWPYLNDSPQVHRSAVGVLGFRSAWPYRKIASALMESGSLYTFAMTAWLIIFISDSVRRPTFYLP